MIHKSGGTRSFLLSAIARPARDKANTIVGHFRRITTG